jgi:lambda repressor-like predicted transcriptional regulator
MSRILGVPPRLLYPAYYLEFDAGRSKKSAPYWNHLVDELVQHGWTTRELAKRCRVSRWTVSRLVVGEHPPTYRIIPMLEKALKKSMSDFWPEWKDQQNRHYRRKHGS